MTAGKIDLFLTEKEEDLSAKSMSRAFTMARRMEKWRPLLATAIYTGLRNGDLFALRKGKVDFDAGVIMVSRSYDRYIPKGGRVEAVPINEELVPYLRKAITASPSELVFPNDDGTMLPKHTALDHVLRRAKRRAGLVTGYVHTCRRQGCCHREAAPHANPIDCPKCEFRLFPVGQVCEIRFHHLCHLTASLLLMKGADLAAVQKIMRHQEPHHRGGLRPPADDLPPLPSSSGPA